MYSFSTLHHIILIASCVFLIHHHKYIHTTSFILYFIVSTLFNILFYILCYAAKCYVIFYSYSVFSCVYRLFSLSRFPRFSAFWGSSRFGCSNRFFFVFPATNVSEPRFYLYVQSREFLFCTYYLFEGNTLGYNRI